MDISINKGDLKMSKRNYKKRGFISTLFSSLLKLVVGVVFVIVGSFILLTGNINMNVSFNKEEIKPVSFIEKIGKTVKLFKNGYNTVTKVIN
jgi:hypothetical protein